MAYRLMADAVVLLHLLFILLVIGGGALALWRHWLAWLHLPALAWGMLATFNRWTCPLTPWENWLRMKGGEAGYGEGFISHYLLPIIYPAGLQSQLPSLAVGVLLLNLGAYSWLLWRWWRG